MVRGGEGRGGEGWRGGGRGGGGRGGEGWGGGGGGCGWVGEGGWGGEVGEEAAGVCRTGRGRLLDRGTVTWCLLKSQ